MQWANTVKLIGISFAINLVLLPIIIPLWNLMEGKGNTILTFGIIIIITIISMILYFFAGRYFLKGTGNLHNDFISMLYSSAIIIGIQFILIIMGFMYFSMPQYLLAILIYNYFIGVIISVILSLSAAFWGMTTRGGYR